MPRPKTLGRGAVDMFLVGPSSTIGSDEQRVVHRVESLLGYGLKDGFQNPTLPWMWSWVPVYWLSSKITTPMRHDVKRGNAFGITICWMNTTAVDDGKINAAARLARWLARGWPWYPILGRRHVCQPISKCTNGVCIFQNENENRMAGYTSFIVGV